MRIEKLHLDCASSAPSHHGSTQQCPLLHRKDYLQGSEIPAVISPSRLVPIIATSPEPMATARLGQMVTLSPRRLAEQPLRLSHNTESPAQGPSSRGQAARAAAGGRALPSAADGGQAPQTAVRPSAADGVQAPPRAAECRRWQPNAAEGGQAPPMAAERRRWRPSSADGGQAPPMAAERRRWRPSSADGGRAQGRRWHSPVPPMAASTAGSV